MALHKGDKSAAYVGLVGGAVTILLLVYAMVLITNATFEGHHEPAAPAAPGAPAAEHGGGGH